MEATCRRALEVGLPSIAFTDHADFVEVFKDQRRLDLEGYLESVERCRLLFPGLHILSGVELGEPHRFPDLARAVLAGGRLDRVLGSVHSIEVDGTHRDLSQQGVMTPARAPALLRSYLSEVHELVRDGVGFEVLAHLDYPRRYWPHDRLPLVVTAFEEEYRAVLREAAGQGLVLEVNTTRGATVERGLCPGPPVIGWWREEGGQRVSFGSDSHEPSRIGAGFALAAAAVEAAGFRPVEDPAGFWRR
jgi:histidinol-phosphatase (PHP family)